MLLEGGRLNLQGAKDSGRQTRVVIRSSGKSGAKGRFYYLPQDFPEIIVISGMQNWALVKGIGQELFIAVKKRPEGQRGGL